MTDDKDSFSVRLSRSIAVYCDRPQHNAPIAALVGSDVNLKGLCPANAQEKLSPYLQGSGESIPVKLHAKDHRYYPIPPDHLNMPKTTSEAGTLVFSWMASGHHLGAAIPERVRKFLAAPTASVAK